MRFARRFAPFGRIETREERIRTLDHGIDPGQVHALRLRQGHREHFASADHAEFFGLLQFVSTFAITGWYVHYSNRKLDPIASDIRHGIEGHEFDKNGNRVDGANK